VVLEVKWLRHPQMRHAEVAILEGPRGLYFKVGMLVNECANPARPRDGVVPTKPWGVELYVPLTQGQDKVQKFLTETAARERVSKAVADFVTVAMGDLI
jgi:hypothetical protein